MIVKVRERGGGWEVELPEELEALLKQKCTGAASDSEEKQKCTRAPSGSDRLSALVARMRADALVAIESQPELSHVFRPNLADLDGRAAEEYIGDLKRRAAIGDRLIATVETLRELDAVHADHAQISVYLKISPRGSATICTEGDFLPAFLVDLGLEFADNS